MASQFFQVASNLLQTAGLPQTTREISETKIPGGYIDSGIARLHDVRLVYIWWSVYEFIHECWCVFLLCCFVHHGEDEDLWGVRVKINMACVEKKEKKESGVASKQWRRRYDGWWVEMMCGKKGRGDMGNVGWGERERSKRGRWHHLMRKEQK